MKKHVCLIIGALLLTSTFAANAQASAKEGGGGDVCQNRIEDIRNDISDWIQEGGSNLLHFDESSTTLNVYNSKMERVIDQTRVNDQTSIACTDDRSLVEVGSAEKTCVSFPDPTHPRILCYRGKNEDGKFVDGFMSLSEDDQYFQIHHELAVLAGIEDQSGHYSDYPLSEQISAHLKRQVVKKLAIKSSCDHQVKARIALWMTAMRIYGEFSSEKYLEFVMYNKSKFDAGQHELDVNGEKVTVYPYIATLGDWKSILAESYIDPLLAEEPLIGLELQNELRYFYEMVGVEKFQDSDPVSKVFTCDSKSNEADKN